MLEDRELLELEDDWLVVAAGVSTGGGGGGGVGLLTAVTSILPKDGTATGAATAGAVRAGRAAAREAATSEARSLIEISVVEPSAGAAGAATRGAAGLPAALAGIAKAATRPPEAARTAEVLMAGDEARDAMRVSSDRGL